jgi:hypothetical protein
VINCPTIIVDLDKDILIHVRAKVGNLYECIVDYSVVMLTEQVLVNFINSINQRRRVND